MRQQRLKFVLVLMVVVVIGWPVCDGTAEAEAQISDQTDVDRPVPVETVYIMAGDRVELVCDVTSSAAYQHDGADGLAGYAPAAAAVISSRSSLKGLAAGQRRSSSGSYYSASRHHQSAGEHRRRNRRYNGNNNHHRRHSTSTAGYDHPSELTMDDGYLVLWFVDPDRKPFYSLDVRRGRSGRHWWNEERFGRRVRFLLPQAPSSSSSSSSSSSTSMGGSFFKNASSTSTLARLQIVNVTRQDGGDYRCRVDFNSAPSRNFKYRLVVIEPPSSVVILDGFLQQLSVVAGPLEEGNDLILTCKAYGGYPQPWVTWWQGGQLLDNTTDARSPESVSNLLVVPRVGRQHLHDAFTCQVTSSPHLAPMMKTVTLELHLRPFFVEIQMPPTVSANNQRAFIAGQSVEVKCRTSGSRPPPSITWWKGNKQIAAHLSAIMNSDDGNATESRLTLTPVSEDDASHLICRVKNSMIPGAVMEDSVRLDVHYAPEVGIALGSNINGDDVKEGDDLYIECHIRANPAFHKLQWTHNGVSLVHNVSAGVVLSNVSLVLRSVTHSRAGLYACSAANSRGETLSQPPLRLRIQYAPRCRSVSAAGTVSGVSKQETASLDCQVDADPSNEVHFWWTFLGTPMKSNGSMMVTSSGDAILLPRSLFTAQGSTSVLQYSPKSELDFGVVACWASNPVGNQREPCLFHVVPAGKPAAPSNCAIHNQTADSVRVDCQEAFDGGLQQTFGLELVDRNTRTLRYVFNNTKPVFTVYGLEPETAFLLNIYALNAKGRSQPITLETTTLRAALKHTGHALYFQMTPLLGVLVGAAVTLLVIVMTVAVVVHRRNRIKRQRQINNQSGESQQNQQQTTALNGPNQPLLPLPHALPGTDPPHNPGFGGSNSTTGNPSISSSNGGHPHHPKNLDEGHHHQRAVLLNKTGNCNGSGVNGQPAHLTKLINSHSSSHHPKGGGNNGNQYPHHHQHQQDPDIILREMVDYQPKRMLPAIMLMNHPASIGGGTLPRGRLHKSSILESEEDDGADLPASFHCGPEQLLLARSCSGGTQQQQQLQSPLSLSSRSSGTSWNIGVAHGGNNHWPASGHQSPSLGLFTNNGPLMQQQQHNMAAAAADLLADCRLPESSL
ncbi:uncharacterized protein LOC124320237 isoform X2 [Daphnia pulicaria]|uniref:uncharacterized protein LOC124320237 isoform X2 n=1 Tax=Daphnia pulicaria TaxID=35523 RepID=UPI001EEB2BAC|nr:uncharacterized protein LOC124320237 isoform X2 [Daphnia pulicaria]